MSGHKNQARVGREEFTAIKAQLKTAGVTDVAKATGRSMATISKIKRSSTHAKFSALNKSYRKTQPVAAPAIQAVVAKPKVVKAEPTLLDTFTKPERRTKAESQEILELRAKLDAATKERNALRMANELLNDANEQLNIEISSLEASEVIRKARTGRSLLARFRRDA